MTDMTSMPLPVKGADKNPNVNQNVLTSENELTALLVDPANPPSINIIQDNGSVTATHIDIDTASVSTTDIA